MGDLCIGTTSAEVWEKVHANMGRAGHVDSLTLYGVQHMVRRNLDLFGMACSDLWLPGEIARIKIR